MHSPCWIEACALAKDDLDPARVRVRGLQGGREVFRSTVTVTAPEPGVAAIVLGGPWSGSVTDR
ncbi:hypothetical protein QQM39_29675 [Streptomyces sp. DT2A-34]|uniref:hypothetical protein n=1 Tax=Streptomyces sp. DT2A-34 TaxID=3051182 RepID=UPI00265C49CD|nr:hypothetical protein [Streptomyces sp. DT2A-34]MDO0914849.1 hypothetical protein [Streptomyces sp. DT2A-34]